VSQRDDFVATPSQHNEYYVFILQNVIRFRFTRQRRALFKMDRWRKAL
jgi:hypothetical protein